MDLGCLETLPIDDPKRVGWTAAFRIFAEFEARYLAEVFKKKPKDGVPDEEFVRWVVDAEIGLFNLRATGLIPAINSYEDADTYKQILQRLESAHLEKYEKSDFSSATRHAILTGIRVGIGSAKFQWTAESLEAARIATQSKAASRETIPTSPSQSAGAVTPTKGSPILALEEYMVNDYTFWVEMEQRFRELQKVRRLVGFWSAGRGWEFNQHMDRLEERLGIVARLALAKLSKAIGPEPFHDWLEIIRPTSPHYIADDSSLPSGSGRIDDVALASAEFTVTLQSIAIKNHARMPVEGTAERGSSPPEPAVGNHHLPTNARNDPSSPPAGGKPNQSSRGRKGDPAKAQLVREIVDRVREERSWKEAIVEICDEFDQCGRPAFPKNWKKLGRDVVCWSDMADRFPHLVKKAIAYQLKIANK
jgi:hypothetical protein